MFIIGLFDSIKKSVSKAVSSVSGSIGGSYSSISSGISGSLGLNSLGLTKGLTGLSTGLAGQLNLNSLSIASITDLLSGTIDFSAIITPLEKVVEFAIKFIQDVGKQNFLNSTQPLSSIIKGYEALDKLMPEVSDFNSFIKWANDVWSLIFGLKPFNIWIGKKNWVDKSKKGLYYNIMRFVAFALIAYKIGFSALHSFFERMIEQRITEHYEYTKLSIQDYQKLEFRGILDDNELTETGHFLGYDKRAMRNVRKATEFFPTVRDVIDFAVKEAFEPDANLFIHNGNAIPEPFSEFGLKLGIDENWIKRFWHSHWRLLGSSQLLEGFHRGFISKDYLLDYLRRLDYTEKDRDLILNMSYNLLTRVDVRRIFVQGLISSRELYDYYGTLGFNEKDKLLMTNLAKEMRFIDTIDLRKLYIERFENGLLNESELKQILHDTGLDLDEINKYLYVSDTEKELEFVIELKKRIETKFYEGDIDFDELVQQLRSLGVSNRELKRIEKNAVLFDFRKKKLPTLGELKRYYRKHIIDLNTFVYYGLRIGLEQQHIFWILQDISE